MAAGNLPTGDDMSENAASARPETGRWLILPAVLIGVRLLGTGLDLFGVMLLKSDTAAELLPPGLDASDPAWMRLIAYEWNTDILVAVLLLMLTVLLLTRSWLFPAAFSAFLGLDLLLRFFHLMLAHGVATLDAGSSQGSYVELMRPAIYCVIWVSYYLGSPGARNVFNRPWPVAKPVSAASS